VEKGTYNCIILENFDETAMKSKDIQSQVLFHRKFPKIHSTLNYPLETSPLRAMRVLTNETEGPPPVPCAITAYPAKFRDPATNLPYCNAYAYKEIQRLKKGEYKWSTLLQAYVGQTQYAARGVPSRFIKPVSTPGEPRSRPVQALHR
jgi:vacuolar protein sorting-associated protein 72